MILKSLLALVALLTASLASAQQVPPVPAPERHPATGLTFPQRIGPAEKKKSMDYGRAVQRPDLGYGWNYEVPGQLTATIYLYTLGNGSIPSGADNPMVRVQFDAAYGEIMLLAKEHYGELKTISGPTYCGVGSVVFRCITFSTVPSADKRPVYTTLLLTGYRGHFLKIRSDAAPGSQGEAAVGSFFSSFGSQLH